MAKARKLESDLPVPSVLVKSRDEVKELINKQIDVSRRILDIKVEKESSILSYDMLGGARSHVDNYVKDQQDEFFRQYNIWNNRNKEIFTRSFQNPNNSDLDGYIKTDTSYFISDVIEEQKSIIRDKVAYMQGFVERLDLIPCEVDTIRSEQNKRVIDDKGVFIVHGHNNALKVDVARTVERMGLKAIILHEQDDNGKTIIEKFEANASEIGFAIILLTGDDCGISKIDLEREKKDNSFKAEYHLRARQNVVFEMGYFIGKLDRAHVVELLDADVEKPGDLDGLLYIPIDEEGMWKIKLAKRLKSVGYRVDFDAII